MSAARTISTRIQEFTSNFDEALPSESGTQSSTITCGTEPFPEFDFSEWKEEKPAKKHCYLHCGHYNCKRGIEYGFHEKESFQALNIHHCHCDNSHLGEEMNENVDPSFEVYDIIANSPVTQSAGQLLANQNGDIVVKVLKSDINPFLTSLERKFGPDLRLRLLSIKSKHAEAFNIFTNSVTWVFKLNIDPATTLFGSLGRFFESYLEGVSSVTVYLAELHRKLIKYMEMALVHLFKHRYGKLDVKGLWKKSLPVQVWGVFEEVVGHLMQMMALRQIKDEKLEKEE